MIESDDTCIAERREKLITDIQGKLDGLYVLETDRHLWDEWINSWPIEAIDLSNLQFSDLAEFLESRTEEHEHEQWKQYVVQRLSK